MPLIHTRHRSEISLFSADRIPPKGPVAHSSLQPHNLVIHAPSPRKIENPQFARNPASIWLHVILLRPVRFNPFRMRLHAPPRIPREQRLGHAELRGARQLISRLPRSVAPASSMRRSAKRLLRSIHLPDAIRSISMSRRATRDARPEHESLHFLTAGFLDSLIADLAIHHWHHGNRRI